MRIQDATVAVRVQTGTKRRGYLWEMELDEVPGPAERLKEAALGFFSGIIDPRPSASTQARRRIATIPEALAMRCIDCRVIFDERYGCGSCGRMEGHAVGR